MQAEKVIWEYMWRHMQMSNDFFVHLIKLAKQKRGNKGSFVRKS